MLIVLSEKLWAEETRLQQIPPIKAFHKLVKKKKGLFAHYVDSWERRWKTGFWACAKTKEDQEDYSDVSKDCLKWSTL